MFCALQINVYSQNSRPPCLPLAQEKLFGSLDMPVFVSQVLISFIAQCWGIPKAKIVPASDYGPPLSSSLPPPKPVQLYTYQKLQQCYHIDCGGNSACLRLQRAPLQLEQWQAELWSRCNVSGEQVKVPLSEWCIITIMCSTNIQYYAGWLLHNRSALHEWLPAGLLLPLLLHWLGGQIPQSYVEVCEFSPSFFSRNIYLSKKM